MTSNLIVHRGSHILTREQLAALPIFSPTRTWRPVPHIDLVRTLADQFHQQGAAVTREQLAVNRSGNLLFGVFDLAVPGPAGDFTGAFGFRTANDRSLAIRAVAGARVLVCDNLALAGDEIVLRPGKHTSGLRLADEAAAAVRRFGDRYQALVGQVQSMKARPITDEMAKQILYDVFSRRLLPLRLLPTAHQEWFAPNHAEFAAQATLWRLHNALTKAAKELPPAPRMSGLTRIGRLFSALLN